MPAAVTVDDLRKSYGQIEAVRGISFEIEQGEVFGLLGPNGAGKTTTVEVLEGYRTRDGGAVTVLGVDPGGRRATGATGSASCSSTSAMYPNLTVERRVALFAGSSPPARRGEVVDLVGLADKRRPREVALRRPEAPPRPRARARRRPGDPVPGRAHDRLRPAARRAAWDMIRTLRELGKTILLTTHYLDEAEQLADRVAVLRDGSIVALGKPEELTGRRVATEIRYRENGREVLLETYEPTKALHELTADALARGVELESLQVRRPTLEEIYLELTEEHGRMRLLLHQLRNEQRLYWRSHELAFFTFLFPVLIFVLLGSVYGNDRIERSTRKASHTCWPGCSATASPRRRSRASRSSSSSGASRRS